MRIIAGKLKGISIPFINDKYNHANVTPQKVKEALFSIIGEDLTGKSFLDLYACSGQIGIEALSRGAEHVVFNEIEPRRFNFIRSQIERLDLVEKAPVFRYHAFRCLRYLYSRGYRFDFIFIDPPYRKKRGHWKLYGEILAELEKHNVLKENGRIIVQHYADNKFEKRAGRFGLVDIREYAKNSLSFFERIIE